MTLDHNNDESFGNVLKEWRRRRKLSQLELSSLTSTSSRHISFLEKGRSKPSRQMVVKLGATMSIPPVEINAALIRVGFSSVYPQAQLDDESVKPLRTAMRTMLDNHSPWPALVCNESWDLLDGNSSVQHLFSLMGIADYSNVMLAMLSADDPDGPFINWVEVAQLMLQRLSAEQLQRPDDANLRDIRLQLQNHPRLQNEQIDESRELNVAVPIRLRIDGKQLSLLSMVAHFGAVQEITYSGIHIELFFPEDNITKAYFNLLPP